MARHFRRVRLGCVLAVGILLVTPFTYGIARADGVHAPAGVSEWSRSIGTDPTGASNRGADLSAADPGSPNVDSSREGGGTAVRRNTLAEAPQAVLPLTPVVIVPQTTGWPRTTAQTTLAGINDDPPVPAKWIDVDLTRQVLTAYIGATPVKSVLVSSGTIYHPTVIGTFNVWAKVPAQTMEGGSHESGDYYKLPNVTDVMYFYAGFALHGAYWHTNFGHPMSHGCVNLTLDDAAWLYDWSPDGITVRTHL